MHVHLGALDAIKVFLMVILVGFVWRVVAMCLSDTSLGRAMAVLY